MSRAGVAVARKGDRLFGARVRIVRTQPAVCISSAHATKVAGPRFDQVELAGMVLLDKYVRVHNAIAFFYEAGA